MQLRSRENHILMLLLVGLLGWIVPGAGYWLIKEKKRAIIVFVTVSITFLLGLYIGSIGVIDPIRSRAWYFAQIMNTPAVALIAHVTAGGGYPVYAKPAEIGQLYTSIAGLLNLLCIVNSVYSAHLLQISREEGSSGDD